MNKKRNIAEIATCNVMNESKCRILIRNLGLNLKIYLYPRSPKSDFNFTYITLAERLSEIQTWNLNNLINHSRQLW